MIEADELKALCQRIIQSGELGRSRTYAAILEYLANQAIAGNTPKEISIAMDVLGRDTDFDVGKDSIVRVHIYHLRNKLEAYFARHGKNEKYRLQIPKGQYMLAAVINEQAVDNHATGRSVTGQPLQRKSLTPWLAGLAIVLLLLNYYQQMSSNNAEDQESVYSQTALWKPLLDDELPVLILIGDYYIMGETDGLGNVTRMVREFYINSNRDLERSRQNGQSDSYMNLDLSYTPTSVPVALAEVMKVLGSAGKQVSIRLMSDYSSEDLVGNHVIYLGYLSGMQSLSDMMFAASSLVVGNTFDELINLDDDVSYTSSSGLSTGDQTYRDYGMLSTFPSPTGSQFLLLAGMRDEGLINLAQEVSMLPSLLAMEQDLGGSSGKETAFELLYEVLGFSNTNIDASLVYSKQLDTDVLWQNRLIGSP